MNSQEIKDLQNVIIEIIRLLESSDETIWHANFISMLQVSKTVNEDDSLLNFCRGIMSNFGGTGSFNDLVLQTNEEALMDKNDKLEFLRNKLYQETKKIIDSRTPDP